MQTDNKHSSEIIHASKSKILLLTEIQSLVKGGCILTKGAFDILHYGHLSLFSYLHSLKQQTLLPVVVAITSDRLIKVKKGDSRPVNPQEERCIQIALLQTVDYLYINDSPDFEESFKALTPQYFIKGMDTISVDETQKTEYLSMPKNSTLIIFSDDSSVSTSEIIKRIKSM